MSCALWMPPWSSSLPVWFAKKKKKKEAKGHWPGHSFGSERDLVVWTCDLLISHRVPVSENQMKRKVMWSLSFNVDVWLLCLSFFFYFYLYFYFLLSFSFGWFGVLFGSPLRQLSAGRALLFGWRIHHLVPWRVRCWRPKFTSWGNSWLLLFGCFVYCLVK